jgi:predicted nucleotidyltransferase
MRHDELLERNRDAILQIAHRHGANNVRVFGSFASGNPGPHSDVNLLVDVGPKRSRFFPGGLVADLEDLLGRTIDIATVNGLHPEIRDAVLSEARPL